MLFPLLLTMFLRRPVLSRRTIFNQLVSIFEFKILWLTLTLYNLVKFDRSVPVLFPAVPVIPQISVVDNRSEHRVVQFGKFLQSFFRGESYARYPPQVLIPFTKTNQSQGSAKTLSAIFLIFSRSRQRMSPFSIP